MHRKKTWITFGAVILCMLFSISARAQGELVVYYSHSSWCMDDIIREFQERYDVAVTPVKSGTVELAGKIVREAEAPQADILWGGTPATYQDIAEYLSPYRSTEDDALYEQFIDKDYRWHGFAVCPVVIAYNTNLVKPDEAPSSYEDLVNPKWENLTALGNPFLSSTALVGYLNILRAHGEDGYGIISGLYQQAGRTLIDASADVYDGIASGTYAVGISYEEGVLRLMAQNQPIQIVYPSEGTNLNCDSVAIVKDAPHLENAQKFIDFLLSWEVQYMLGSMYRHSVRMDIPAQGTIIPLEEIPDVGYTEDWALSASREFLTWWEKNM